MVLESECGPEGKAQAARGHVPLACDMRRGGLEGSQSGALGSTGLRTRVLSPGSKDNAFLSNLTVYSTVPTMAREGEDFVVNF